MAHLPAGQAVASVGQALPHLLSQNNEARSAAEAALTGALAQSADGFTQGLLLALQGSLGPGTAALAAVLLRRRVLPTGGAAAAEAWASLAPETQAHVKATLLAELGALAALAAAPAADTAETRAQRPLVDCIGELAASELGGAAGAAAWPEVLPAVQAAVASGSVAAREAGLEIIGQLSDYIAERPPAEALAAARAVDVGLSDPSGGGAVCLAAVRALSMLLYTLDTDGCAQLQPLLPKLRLLLTPGPSVRTHVAREAVEVRRHALAVDESAPLRSYYHHCTTTTTN